MDSLIYLDHNGAPPSLLFWGCPVVNGVVGLVVVVMNGWRILQVLTLYLFHQRSCEDNSPYVFIITGQVPTLTLPVDGITLVDHRIFVHLGETRRLTVDGAATFEVQFRCHTYHRIFLKLSHKTLCIGYVLCGPCSYLLWWHAGVPLVPWLLTPSMASLEDLLSLFIHHLSKAHFGYLHWVRAFLRCSFSCLSNLRIAAHSFGLYGRGC